VPFYEGHTPIRKLSYVCVHVLVDMNFIVELKMMEQEQSLLIPNFFALDNILLKDNISS